MYFPSSTSAQVVASKVANFNDPQYPDFDDFGDVVVASDHATGHMRVDWFTPDGLGHWGDGRMTILGTDGYIELRKYIDVAGRPGGDHIFLVDKQGTRYIDGSQTPLTYGKTLIADVLNRTDTTMTQQHSFAASELALQAQAQARRIR